MILCFSAEDEIGHPQAELTESQMGRHGCNEIASKQSQSQEAPSWGANGPNNPFFFPVQLLLVHSVDNKTHPQLF